MIGIFQGRGIADRARVHAQIDVDFRAHIQVFNTGKNLNPLGVFLCIALHANEGGWAWPGRGLIKKETGISTDAALTSALAHLRNVRIDGNRVFAHFRENREDKKHGRSAYLIFPDLPAGPLPAHLENLQEYHPTKSQKPSYDNPLTDNPVPVSPLVENPLLEEEPLQEEPYKFRESEKTSPADALDDALGIEHKGMPEPAPKRTEAELLDEIQLASLRGIQRQGKRPWLNWSNGRLKPRRGIDQECLDRVGWLIDSHTHMRVADGEWKGWTAGGADIYQAGQGKWGAIEAGIRTAWGRSDPQYRPGHAKGFVKEVRKAASTSGGGVVIKVENKWG